MKTTITVKGTHCQSCATLINDICSEFPGVVKCDVDVKTGKTVIEHTGKLDLGKIKKAIEGVGKYTVVV